MPSATPSSRRSFLVTSAVVIGAGALAFLRFGRANSAPIVGTPGKVKIQKFDDLGKSLGEAEVDKVVKTDAEWQAQLANAPGTNPPSDHTAYTVAREEDTEYPGTGPNAENFSAGLYRCICCDNALYTNATKFDSGTGWPSFWQPIAEENVVHTVPQQGGYKVSCALCDAHLGHVFNDGPKPTGLRYCMDGVAMRFIPWAAA